MPPYLPPQAGGRSSILFDASRKRFVVRWQEGGRRRVRRFASEEDAVAFEAAIARPQPPDAAPVTVRPGPAGDGIYPYETNAGRRYRFVFRQSDGTLSSRRGFTNRRTAAAARRALMESVDRREIVVCREDFETFWERFVCDRRPYLTSGSHLVR